jgi:hypothetical protein
VKFIELNLTGFENLLGFCIPNFLIACEKWKKESFIACEKWKTNI